MVRRLPSYATVDIRTLGPWLVNAQPNALHTKQKLQPLTNLHSSIEYQMKISKLGLKNKKNIELVLNFPDTSGN